MLHYSDAKGGGVEGIKVVEESSSTRSSQINRPIICFFVPYAHSLYHSSYCYKTLGSFVRGGDGGGWWSKAAGRNAGI